MYRKARKGQISQFTGVSAPFGQHDNPDIVVDKFCNQTKWKPEITFEKTLEDILEYWRNYYKTLL